MTFDLGGKPAWTGVVKGPAWDYLGGMFPALIAALVVLAAPLDADEYSVGFEGKGPYAAGKKGAVTVTLTARKGYHVNPEYPVTFKPEGAEALHFAEERLKLAAGKKTPCADNAKDACVAEFPVEFVPEKKGAAKFAGTFAFSVCTAKMCLVKKVLVALALNTE